MKNEYQDQDERRMMLLSLLSGREGARGVVGILDESALAPNGTFEKRSLGLLMVELAVAH